jgi:hypothetical protein
MTIFDQESPLTDEELVILKEYARERIVLWRRRALYSTIALVLSCTFLSPFLEGQPLHKYWQSFGKYLVILSVILLVPFVYCVGLFWSAWKALRDIEKGQGYPNVPVTDVAFTPSSP